MAKIGHNNPPLQSIFCNAKKGDRYTSILNDCLQNSKLSLAAKGLLAELLSMPNDWVIVAKNLIRKGSGRDKIYSLISELITQGYMGKTVLKDGKNQFAGEFYWVSDKPFPEYPEAGIIKPFPELPEAGKSSIKTPAYGKPVNGPASGFPVYGKHESGIKDKNNIKTKTPVVPAGDTDLFEEFWKAFPPGRKRDKGRCRTKFRSIVSGKNPNLKASAKTLIAAAKAYDQSLGGDYEFVCMPSTWLNGGRWEDDIEPQEKPLWQTKPELFRKLSSEKWIAGIEDAKPNGHWPTEKFGPYIDQPGCLMPDEVKAWCQDKFGEKYLSGDQS